jgi:hypothetical protein
MANFKTLALTALLLGCSGSSEDDESFTCDTVADRDGTYWMEFETLSGTCPDQDSALVRLDSTGETPPGCTELSPPETSDSGCTLEVHRSCPAGDSLPGVEIELTAITTQQDEAGETFGGILTMYLRDSSGELCHGSFRLTATRQ